MRELLEQIGLTPTETKVYLALLELGESKTGEILKKANLNSGRIYEVLDSLEKKGLVSSIVKNKVRLFVPSPPARVLTFVDEEIRELEDKKKEFKKNLSRLEKKFNELKQKTKVEVFFGGKGQRTAYSILFKEAKKDKDLCVIGVSTREKYPKEIIDNLIYYVYKERKRLRLKTKKLVAEEARNEKMFAKDASARRFLPFPLITSIQILGDVTFITIEIEPIITILILDKRISKDYKKQFEFLWSKAKK